MARESNIQGLSFSWKRALKISGAKQRFARQAGILTSRTGLERKIGSSLLRWLLSNFLGSKK